MSPNVTYSIYSKSKFQTTAQLIREFVDTPLVQRYIYMVK